MKVLGIDFDPWDEPISRRLETFAAGITYFIVILGPLIFMFFTGYVILYTCFWWLVALYLTWIYLDRETCEKGGRSLKWTQQWTWWRYGCAHFPLKLAVVPEATFNPKKNYLFSIFPHGVLPAGGLGAFLTDSKEYNQYFPEHQARLATLPLFYHIPFYRELAFSIGGISCSSRSLNYLLSRQEGGYIAAISIGGAAESYNSEPGTYKIKLKNRKGFVKLALKNGSPLVPVISFGETDIYVHIKGPRLHKIQELLRRFTGFAPLILNGRGLFQNTFGLVPRRAAINVLVGKPIEFDRTEEPTNQQIDELHEKFTVSLKNMFEKYKYNYLEDPQNKFLEIE